MQSVTMCGGSHNHDSLRSRIINRTPSQGGAVNASQDSLNLDS